VIAPQFTITLGGKGDPKGQRELTLSLDSLPKHLRVRLRSRITVLTQRLLANVKAAEPVHTGRLRSLTHAWITETDTAIRGGVSIAPREGAHNVAAAALEYGQHRMYSVRAHTARLMQVFGHPITPESVMIKAHARRPHIAARRFLRGPAAALRPIVIAELQAAVNEAVADTNRS
jgi:hypothetical protein